MSLDQKGIYGFTEGYGIYIISSWGMKFQNYTQNHWFNG